MSWTITVSHVKLQVLRKSLCENFSNVSTDWPGKGDAVAVQSLQKECRDRLTQSCPVLPFRRPKGSLRLEHAPTVPFPASLRSLRALRIVSCQVGLTTEVTVCMCTLESAVLSVHQLRHRACNKTVKGELIRIMISVGRWPSPLSIWLSTQTSHMYANLNENFRVLAICLIDLANWVPHCICIGLPQITVITSLSPVAQPAFRGLGPDPETRTCSKPKPASKTSTCPGLTAQPEVATDWALRVTLMHVERKQHTPCPVWSLAHCSHRITASAPCGCQGNKRLHYPSPLVHTWTLTDCGSSKNFFCKSCDFRAKTALYRLCKQNDLRLQMTDECPEL